MGPFPSPISTQARFDRKEAARRFLREETTSSIAESYGVTREAVRQALAKMGIRAADGGSRARARREAAVRARSAKRAAAKRARYVERAYGISVDQYHAIRATREGSIALHAYAIQRKAAIYKGVRWRLTFPQWRRVWASSGMWDRRGAGAFGLARISRTRPFERGNVAIVWQPYRFRSGVIPRSAQALRGRCRDAEN